MNTPAPDSTPPLDAEALYAQVLQAVRPLLTPQALLVGIWSGGAWVAERLQRDLGLPGECGVISSTLHRDDFSSRGLAGADRTHLPVSIEGRHVVLVDDVIFTGRTIRAVINELFDFGRPARVSLVALADRGGRELPIQPDFVAARVALAANQKLALARDAAGRFDFSFKENA
jgi:pyrimidine operon attenuation protein/uracil phosphoribosyltransferase